jgi:hypothetical protein
MGGYTTHRQQDDKTKNIRWGIDRHTDSKMISYTLIFSKVRKIPYRTQEVFA